MQRIDFDKLARYNGEKSRGIMHTDEYKKKMKLLQQQYDKEIRTQGGLTIVIEEEI